MGAWSVFISAIDIVQAWLPFYERDHVIAKQRVFDFGGVFHKADKVVDDLIGWFDEVRLLYNSQRGRWR